MRSVPRMPVALLSTARRKSLVSTSPFISRCALPSRIERYGGGRRFLGVLHVRDLIVSEVDAVFLADGLHKIPIAHKMRVQNALLPGVFNGEERFLAVGGCQSHGLLGTASAPAAPIRPDF